MTTEEILVKLGVDTKTAKAGMEGMKDYLLDWARAMRTAIIGAFAFEGLKQVFEKNIEYGEKIYDLSKRLGISATAVQAWDFALKKNSSSIEAATGFFEKLGTARDKALQGNGQAIEAFKELNVTLDELKSKRLEDIAEQIGDIFKGGGDPQALIGALREIGGRSAGEMIPTFVNGIKEARDEAEKLGLILSDDVIAKLKQAGDEWTQLGAQLRSATAPWVASVVDGLETLITIIMGGLKAIGAYVSTLAKHPFSNPWNDASDAAKAAFNKEWDDMIEADKARERAAGQPARDAADLEASQRQERAQEKIDRLKKEASDNEDRAAEKKKSDEEQLNDLILKRINLMLEAFQNRGDELAHAQTMLDISKTDLDITDKQNQIDRENTQEMQRQAHLADQIQRTRERISFLSGQREQDLLAPAQSSIEDIAKSGWWSRQSGFSGGRWQWNRGPFAGIAQEIERLQMDAKNSLLYFGNKDRAKADLARAGVLRGQLEEAGLISPERRLESIDEEIKRLNKTLQDGSGSIQVGNGP